MKRISYTEILDVKARLSCWKKMVQITRIIMHIQSPMELVIEQTLLILIRSDYNIYGLQHSDDMQKMIDIGSPPPSFNLLSTCITRQRQNLTSKLLL